MTNDQAYGSDLPVPPGEYLEEVLDELGMSKDELARRMNRPASKLSAIFKGKKAVTPSTSLQLEKVVDVPAHIWLGLESDYRIALARRQEEKERERLKEESFLIRPFCYSTLVKLGAVKKYTKREDKVKALQKFFGVTSLYNVKNVARYAAAFRCGRSRRERSPEAVAAWLRLGEVKAGKIICREFSKKRVKDSLEEIRQMTFQSPEVFLPKLTSLLADCGIAFTLCPHFPGTYVNGAVFPLGRGRIVVMMTLRGKWADIFWFSLFHELGHVVLHDRRTVIVECEEGNRERKKMEDEADDFAAETLVSSDKWSVFIRRRSFGKASIEKFAADVGIAPGIIAGRLQREGYLRHSRRNDLRIRYDWSTPP